MRYYMSLGFVCNTHTHRACRARTRSARAARCRCWRSRTRSNASWPTSCRAWSRWTRWSSRRSPGPSCCSGTPPPSCSPRSRPPPPRAYSSPTWNATVTLSAGLSAFVHLHGPQLTRDIILHLLCISFCFLTALYCIYYCIKPNLIYSLLSFAANRLSLVSISREHRGH